MKLTHKNKSRTPKQKIQKPTYTPPVIKLTHAYRIFSIEDGRLVRPQEYGYGHPDNKFQDFDTIEEAHAALLQDRGGYGDYLILPVTVKDLYYENNPLGCLG